MSQWGPSHQNAPAGKELTRVLLIIAALLCFLVLAKLPVWVTTLVLVLSVGVFLVRVARRTGRGVTLLHRRHKAQRAVENAVARVAVSGVILGYAKDGAIRRSRPEQATLVIGPPRSYKTTAVIIPTVRAHQGPAVCTSTKPDVLAATFDACAGRGRVLRFDPTGKAGPAPAGVEVLRWSPLLCSHEWDGAMLMARAMVNGARVGSGTTDSTHWSKRAEALLAPLLHAAALGGLQIVDVLNWVSAHELTVPLEVLERLGATAQATNALTGLANTESRERSSIFSACADALDAYRSDAALAAATDPNFYPGRFVLSNDTVFINAPADAQYLAAPLVCGLLAEIRRATYQAHAARVLNGRMLFALDEVANIAPIEELPQIASEGGGQGLTLLAVLQDLSQARQRWGAVADGFLTLFGTKLIMRGVADQRTLESISVALGEYDRQVVANTSMKLPGKFLPQRGHTVSTQRTRVLSPGEIANIPDGQALHLDGVRWELLKLASPGAVANGPGVERSRR